MHCNPFCSTHSTVFEAMDENQEIMVKTFMDTSLKYLHGATEHGLYTMVIRCLEVCVSVVHVCMRVCKHCVMSLYYHTCTPYVSGIIKESPLDGGEGQGHVKITLKTARGRKGTNQFACLF